MQPANANPHDLGNMRANGVRTLAAWCLGRGCNHYRVLYVSGYPDDRQIAGWTICSNGRFLYAQELEVLSLNFSNLGG